MKKVLLAVLLLTNCVFAETKPINEKTYDEAYKEAQSGEKLLVVLMGAKWCPGCVKMHEESWPDIVQEPNAIYTYLDIDEQPKMAQQMMSGNSIPQIVVYKYSKINGWSCERRIGFCEPGPIRRWLKNLFCRE